MMTGNNFKEYLIGLALMTSSDKDEKDVNVHEDKVLRLAFRILIKMEMIAWKLKMCLVS